MTRTHSLTESSFRRLIRAEARKMLQEAHDPVLQIEWSEEDAAVYSEPQGGVVLERWQRLAGVIKG